MPVDGKSGGQPLGRRPPGPEDDDGSDASSPLSKADSKSTSPASTASNPGGPGSPKSSPSSAAPPPDEKDESLTAQELKFAKDEEAPKEGLTCLLANAASGACPVEEEKDHEQENEPGMSPLIPGMNLEDQVVADDEPVMKRLPFPEPAATSPPGEEELQRRRAEEKANQNRRSIAHRHENVEDFRSYALRHSSPGTTPRNGGAAAEHSRINLAPCE